jgi:hypothetical protein
LFGIIGNAAGHISEGSSSNELILGLVDLSILVIDLNLMEGMLSHASGVNHKSTLSYAAFLLICLLIVVIAIVRLREYWFWLANNLEWL